MGDLFERVLKLKQKLPQLAGLGARVEKEEAAGVALAAQAESRPRTKKTKTASRPRRKV